MNEHKGNTNEDSDPHKSGDSMGGMMIMMMAMCLGAVLLFLVIPAVGFPLGLIVAIVAGALMLVLHGRFMRHG